MTSFSDRYPCLHYETSHQATGWLYGEINFPTAGVKPGNVTYAVLEEELLCGRYIFDVTTILPLSQAVMKKNDNRAYCIIIIIIIKIIIQHLYSAMGSYWDTEALVAPVKTV